MWEPTEDERAMEKAKYLVHVSNVRRFGYKYAYKKLTSWMDIIEWAESKTHHPTDARRIARKARAKILPNWRTHDVISPLEVRLLVREILQMLGERRIAWMRKRQEILSNKET